MEVFRLKQSLLAGNTANAFKLGTVLTLGWFWMRRSGCCLLYRGPSIESVDFEKILAVADNQASWIQPTDYLQHKNDANYFYVLRKANGCGDQEQTLCAAAKVSIGPDGELVPVQPNSIIQLTAKQAAGDRIELGWFYCPLDQQSGPVRFNIYSDNASGQIDYQNPLGVIDYDGPKFYSYQTGTLQPVKYLFAVKTQNNAATEDGSSAFVGIQVNTDVPANIDVLSTETI